MSWISYFSFTFDYLGNYPFYPSIPQVRQVLSWPVYSQHHWMKSILNILALVLWDRSVFFFFVVVVASYMSFMPEAEVSAKARHDLYNESVCKKIQNSFSIISNRNKFYPSNFWKLQQRRYCPALEAVTLSFTSCKEIQLLETFKVSSHLCSLHCESGKRLVWGFSCCSLPFLCNSENQRKKEKK